MGLFWSELFSSVSILDLNHCHPWRDQIWLYSLFLTSGILVEVGSIRSLFVPMQLKGWWLLIGYLQFHHHSLLSFAKMRISFLKNALSCLRYHQVLGCGTLRLTPCLFPQCVFSYIAHTSVMKLYPSWTRRFTYQATLLGLMSSP